ncbi:Hypothetical protein ETEE_2790 [Edwardsiella anguillarum ET080813]|uniref:Uncharacterized protein n=1 Tax=Edwardsiella anguillarum ET080813 TaxID=667120 RepID=A0A076LRP5_9GAMM|nr:Hypothetical protein ETEE_2790 [Edwardsiella anguillarum ET080813]
MIYFLLYYSRLYSISINYATLAAGAPGVIPLALPCVA